MLNVDTASVYTDFNGLAKLKQGAHEQSPDAIKQVASQFESLFLNMVLKNMRQAKLAESVMDSKQSEFYRDMFDQQMALQLAAKPGVGLADMIAKQLMPAAEADSADSTHLAVADYLDRGLGSRASVSRHASAVTSGDTANPLDESGLDRLQATLEKLEASHQALQGRWQRMGVHETSVAAAVPASGEGFNRRDQFMTALRPHAEAAARELGVNPGVLLAQVALETGWGQSVIKDGRGESSFNVFNIKADKTWQGRQARVSTLEYDGGVPSRTTAGFRAYESYKDSFDDYVNLIKSHPRYSEALKKADNPAHYLRELQQAGYATDPRYAEKVMTIYRHQVAAQSGSLEQTG
ncbi:MAG: flagellar assembly peptidoglycan hydrolase FlgJ [Methylomonas sp.]|nr:flagellar assembly peptidoglycan hydrolase FlgJ [Methylomonas sp.]PPD19983.1 MAG: flagellar assembly peptidoglycan hydrolase FlgJ [Methylomonas sp.]PPD26515.1 MAG: flagellar assembly peptidoglycan hydrolase FlgJ [Methylomonas sp.]PPD36947.1 MAG: flagellar assembly peptidoglycan hydrolase FlgJ [Methylomonas sp.]PPD38283.1 MAG: flagellar assembly peptidoglycan hydrolase FlgJ [Methylomonas sp.]